MGMSPDFSVRTDKEVTMYGTVGRLQIKDGYLSKLTEMIRELETTPGVLAMSIVSKDGSEIDNDWTIVWTDKEAHDANGARPEFSREYERLLAMLAAEPEWHSGEIVYVYETGST
jgi:hypothetical protein